MIYLIIALTVLLSSCTSENSAERIPQTTAAASPSAEAVLPENEYSAAQTPVLETPLPDKTQKPEKRAQSNIAAEFTTPLIDKGENRLHNIRLAADSINGYVLKNGCEFSFNKIVGERSVERGYKTAPVLVGTEHTEGLGGGVCQTAATIYNAAVKAGMEITEHHTHKIEVAYAKNGTDATVNYDDMDLKFKNNLGCNVKIEVKVNKHNVNVKIVKI